MREPQKKAFQEMRDELTKPRVDPKPPTKITADASSKGLGTVLLQKNKDNQWKPIVSGPLRFHHTSCTWQEGVYVRCKVWIGTIHGLYCAMHGSAHCAGNPQICCAMYCAQSMDLGNPCFVLRNPWIARSIHRLYCAFHGLSLHKVWIWILILAQTLL